MDSAQYGRLFVTNFNIFAFSRFRTNLLAENHSIIRAKTKFAVVEKAIKFLLEIITLVSSANNMGSAREFILNERSLYKLEIVRAPGQTPGGLYASIYPNQKLNCELNWVILFLLCFPFVKYDLNQSIVIPRMP